MRYFVGIMLVCLVSVPLDALEAMAQVRERGPCAADVERVCKEVQPGGGRIMKCLKEHEAQPSADCREQMVETYTSS